MQLAHAAAFLCELKRRRLEIPDAEGAQIGKATRQIPMRTKQGRGYLIPRPCFAHQRDAILMERRPPKKLG